MFRVSKICPRCRARYPLELVCCVQEACTRLGDASAEGRIAQPLWIVELLSGGIWRWHPPNSLNDATVRHLARTSGDGSGDAA